MCIMEFYLNYIEWNRIILNTICSFVIVLIVIRIFKSYVHLNKRFFNLIKETGTAVAYKLLIL